jgi:hypothetical protein
VPPEQAIHHGPINKIKDVVAEYAACGLDLLVLMPEVRSLRQLEVLSEHVLPEYRYRRVSGPQERPRAPTISTRLARAELLRSAGSLLPPV